MENKELPLHLQEEINQKAKASIRLKNWGEGVQFESYVRGATAYATWKVKYDELQKAKDTNVEILIDNQKRAEADIQILNADIESIQKENDELVQENERLKAKVNELMPFVEAMVYYSQIHTVRGVRSAEMPTHEIAWKSAQRWLWDNCKANKLGNYTLKEGESNTPAPVQEIEYMPILSAELSELRKYANVPVRVPMHLLNDEQADRNHGQTLQRLKERGGLGIKEALSLITCNNWSYYRDLPIKEAIAMLNDIISNNTPAPVQGENKIVVHDNSDAFRNWVTEIKGYEISLLGHFTGVALPIGVTSEMLAKEWYEYVAANKPQ